MLDAVFRPVLVPAQTQVLVYDNHVQIRVKGFVFDDRKDVSDPVGRPTIFTFACLNTRGLPLSSAQFHRSDPMKSLLEVLDNLIPSDHND